jgi:hypothetical protein
MPAARKRQPRSTYRRPAAGNFMDALCALTLGALGTACLLSKPSNPPIPPQPRYWGIATEVFDFIAASQEQEMWCWAASIQMLLNFYRVPVTQEQIVSRVYGIPLNQPGTDNAISASLHGWGINANGKHFTVQSCVAPGPPSPQVLFRELSRGHPILLTFNPGFPLGHAVVVTAASSIGTIVTSLVYRDPSQTPTNIENKGRVELFTEQLAQFLPSVQSHWLVTVREW